MEHQKRDKTWRQRLVFVQNKVSLLREGDLIKIEATSPFKLVFNGTTYQVKSGTSLIKIKQ